jgi:hypothetical protein
VNVEAAQWRELATCNQTARSPVYSTLTNPPAICQYNIRVFTFGRSSLAGPGAFPYHVGGSNEDRVETDLARHGTRRWLGVPAPRAAAGASSNLRSNPNLTD